jgi:hypothetical protein
MPSVSVRLARSQIDDIVSLCRLGPPQLNALADALQDTRPTIKRDELRRVVAETITDPAAAQGARRVLSGLSTATRRFNVPSTELLESVGENLLTQKLDESDLRAWHESRPIIERMLSAPIIGLDAKAKDLAFDFERLYARARILTDIRPVFDDARDDIVGVDITQTLRLDYMSPVRDGATTLSIAMDTADIEQLKKCCEDALQKANKAREYMEKINLDVAMPGRTVQ